MLKLSGIPYQIVGLFLFINFLTSCTNAAKILGLFAHPGESHFSVMRTIVTELIRREHNVTIYSSHRMPEQIENLKEYVIEPEYPFWKELQKAGNSEGSLRKLSQLSAGTLQKHLGTVGSLAVDYFLSSEPLQNLLHMDGTAFDYDLIIIDLFYTEALLAFGHYFNTPSIGIVSTNFENYMQHSLESIMPIACSPIDFENYNPYAGYWERLSNTRDCITRRKEFAKTNFAAQEKLIKKHFGHYNVPTPTMSQLQTELAVLLLNNHVPLAIPRPMLPNTIAAGGLHIRPARELPWHIRRFLDEARSGVIYMNLGNEQLCNEIPKTQLTFLLKVLGQRNERVLWTCHDIEKLHDAPKNMMFQHVTPQTDILAHPHVRVFIMNGDLLSLQDGIVRHVPMIGIPIFRHEQSNMKLAETLGVGVSLNVNNLTENALNEVLDAMLFKSEYAMTIREVSTAFRDRPMGALETANYWLDYALRHNSGAQIKTKGIGIPSNQLHLFDLFIFYFLMAFVFVGALVGIYFIGLWVWRKQQVEKMYRKLN